MAESDDITSNVLSDSNTIEISEDGFTVIEPEPAENFDGKGDVIAEAAVFVPQTDPDIADAGNYTLPERMMRWRPCVKASPITKPPAHGMEILGCVPIMAQPVIAGSGICTR